MLAPTIVSIGYDGTQTEFEWQPLQGTGITYSAIIQATDGSTQFASPPVTGTSVAIPQVLPPGHTYQAQVFGTQNGIPGPGSSPLTLILDAPQLSSVNYDGTNATVYWNSMTLPSGTQYAALVEATDGSFEEAAAPTSGTNAVIPCSLDTQKTYNASVNLVSGVVSGPPSNLSTILTAPPGTPLISYDLINLSGTWTGVSGQNILYTALVYATDGSFSEATPPSPNLSASVPLVLEGGKTYLFKAQAMQGSNQGPWSVPAPTPFATQVIYQYDQLSRLQTVTSDAAFVYTYSYSDAGNLNTIAAAPE
ncbi:hypothetical protein ACX0G9_04210 [Flavitalea flava]